MSQKKQMDDQFTKLLKLMPDKPQIINKLVLTNILSKKPYNFSVDSIVDIIIDYINPNVLSSEQRDLLGFEANHAQVAWFVDDKHYCGGNMRWMLILRTNVECGYYYFSCEPWRGWVNTNETPIIGYYTIGNDSLLLNGDGFDSDEYPYSHSKYKLTKSMTLQKFKTANRYKSPTKSKQTKANKINIIWIL
eukprot:455422_1